MKINSHHFFVAITVILFGSAPSGGIAPNQVIARSEFEVHLKCLWSECNEGCD